MNRACPKDLKQKRREIKNTFRDLSEIGGAL